MLFGGRQAFMLLARLEAKEILKSTYTQAAPVSFGVSRVPRQILFPLML